MRGRQFTSVLSYAGNLRTTTNGRVGWLLSRTGSLSGHPSKQQPRLKLLDPISLCLGCINGDAPLNDRPLVAQSPEYPPAPRLITLPFPSPPRRLGRFARTKFIGAGTTRLDKHSALQEPY
ncbi:hypothetical protein J6590_041901 [Homalodisca vitripennis]|nr:hypothetical protein J6590_041901 [Homalodisca vitripennis]